MSKQFINSKGEKIILAEQAFAMGGEGAIYEIVSPTHAGFVAKVYHKKELAAQREEKIVFMQQNNPTTHASPELKRAIVWVESALYDETDFVGFIMPKVQQAISLKSLTLVQSLSKKYGPQWRKFDHDQLGAHQKRLVIAYNLSQAVNVLHQTGKYVLVDMKPENILLREDASIALIDLDGIQINNKTSDQNGVGLRQFPASVFTEEYVPPEKYKETLLPKKGKIHQEWDYFSLAVIIYELLFGIHPYQASHQLLTTRSELIKEGFFVQGGKQEELHKIPYLHDNFDRLDPALRKQFYNTFEEGHASPQYRTSADAWANSLFSVLNQTSAYQTKMEIVPVTSKTEHKSFIIEDRKKPLRFTQRAQAGTILSGSTTGKNVKKTGSLKPLLSVFCVALFAFVVMGSDPIGGTFDCVTGYTNFCFAPYIEPGMRDADKKGIDWIFNPHVEKQLAFKKGDSKALVLQLMGEPDRIEGKDSFMPVLIYGKSAVYLVEGKVADYHNAGNLYLE